MAKFNAFDEHCDASAVLTLLGKVPVFSAAVQSAAGVMFDKLEMPGRTVHSVIGIL